MRHSLTAAAALVILVTITVVVPVRANAIPLTTPVIVLVNGTLIDGTGADPVPNAALAIQEGRITAVGPCMSVAIPVGAVVIDVQGGTILPGFINAHVHNAYDAKNLQAWAQAGVTTVRDESAIGGALSSLLSWRDHMAQDPQYARLVSAGVMITVPGGYGFAFVSSLEEARQVVNSYIDQGTEVIKLSMEDGYAGRQNLPKLTPEELAALIVAAHERHVKVSAHVTQAQYLQIIADAGVDDAAHIVYDTIPDDLIKQMVAQDMYIVPTLTVFEAYGVLGGSSSNLGNFVKAGGKIALGNDYMNIPQNGFDHFDLGIPMHEIERMAEAGVTPMQIIVAATKNGAHVSNLDKELGTLEAGKQADILVIKRDPLQDLKALTDVRLVIHNGVVIRSEN